MSEPESESAAQAAEVIGARTPPTTAAASRSAAIQLVARGVLLLAAVLSTALLARYLGDGYAAWATVLISVTLASILVEPGLSPILARRLSTDPRLVPSRRTLTWLRCALGVFALGVVVVGSVVSRGPDIVVLALCLGGQVMGRSVVNNANGWLLADQRVHRLAVLETGAALLGLLGLYLGVRTDASPAVLGLVGYTLPYAVLAVVSTREITLSPSSRVTPEGSDWPKVRSLLVETLPLTGAIALGALYVRSSVFFVNRFVDDSEASKFFFSFLFAEQTMTIAGITAGALLPVLVRRALRSRLLGDPLSSDLLLVVACLGVGVAALLIAGAELLTEAIGGPEMVGADVYIRLMAPFAAVMLPAMLLAFMFISERRVRRYLVYGAVGLVANLAMNLAWVPEWGAAASARISWATELVVLVLPLYATLRGGPRARATAAAVLGLIAVCIASSELSARGATSPYAAAGLLVVIGAAVALRPSKRVIAAEREGHGSAER